MTSYKQIIKTSYKVGLPIAIQALVLSSVRLVDNLFIGHLPNATHVSSGINAVSNVSFVMSTIIAGFIAGIGVYFAQASSAKDLEKQRIYFRIKLFMWLTLSVLFLSSAFIFLKPLAKLWIPSGPGQDMAADYAFDYGKYVIPTLAIDMLVVVFSSSFVQQRKTKLTMLVAIAAIIINSSLNYPLMYTLKMGVEGSAVATMIARFAELVIWFVYIMIKKPEFMGKIRHWFLIDFKALFKSLPKASMWSLNSLLGSLAFTIQILLLSRTSISAGASMIIAGTFAQLIYALVGGYTQAANVILAYEITKDKPKEFRSFVHKSSHIALVFGIICGSLLLSIMPLMSVLYPKYDAATISDSKIMITAIAITMSFGMIFSVYSSSLKSAGYSKLLLIMDSVFAWCFSVGLTVLLTQLDTGISFGWIYFIVGMTSLPKMLFSVLMFEINWKKLKPLVKNETKEVEEIKV